MYKGDDGKTMLHAYPKPRPTDADEGVVTLTTKKGSFQFFTNSHMSRQALDFEDMCEQIADRVRKRHWEPIDIRVYGQGLLPAYAASIGLHADPLMNQKYCGKEAA